MATLSIFDLPENIQNKIIPEPMSGCWLWIGAKNKKGYGTGWFGNGESKLATHFILKRFGKASPSHKHGALHTCDNPPCVNPSHLYWGTMKENTADMIRRGRQDQSGLSMGSLFNIGKFYPIKASIGWNRERKYFKCTILIRDFDSGKYDKVYIGYAKTKEEIRERANSYIADWRNGCAKKPILKIGAPFKKKSIPCIEHQQDSDLF